MIYMYRVLTAQTIEKLEKKVNESIKDGWKPQGGVQFAKHLSYNSSIYEYVQAMIK